MNKNLQKKIEDLNNKSKQQAQLYQNQINSNQINQNLINYNQINQIQMLMSTQTNNNNQIPKKKKNNIISTFKIAPQKGLVNIGYTCYMNATLQCFSQTEPLTEYFLNSKHKEIIINRLFNNNKNDLRLAKEYYYVVNNLWNNDGLKFYEPKKFKKVLGTLNNLFEKMEASDAKDMIVFFLEQIHKEINLVQPKAPPNVIINQYNREVMLNYFVKEFTKNNRSIISDNFFIINETTQKCQNCKNNNTPNYICYNYNIQNCFIFPFEEVRKFRGIRLIL